MSKHLKFVKAPQNPSKKTAFYVVVSNHDDSELGFIEWNGGWRQYCFYPYEDCVWSWDCLKDLSEFIKGLMDERKVSS
jgi:hypothetical protein